MLQSYIDALVEELERVVSEYEIAVEEVEHALDKAEEASVSGDPCEHLHIDRNQLRLDNALQNARQLETLVKAVNVALNDAIDAAQLVVTNERVGLPDENCEASANCILTGDASTPQLVLNAVGVAQLDTSLEALSNGAIIIQGKYCVVRLLHCRPRLNLYLAERTNIQSRKGEGAPFSSLVVIRELVLSGLSPEINKQIERAAFEEFAAPMLFGSPHFPGVGDRMYVENARHYTIMQLRQVRGRQHALAVSLAELLIYQPRWPAWLDVCTAWKWGEQLCRIVVRLHRMGVTLGDLHPATILVDPQSAADWAPVLLVSWPPPSRFWPISTFSDHRIQELSTEVFPIAVISTDDAFAAPEIFTGRYDERSDVYSLGAILYLLLTRYAPIAAMMRAHLVQNTALDGMCGEQGLISGEGRCTSEYKELIPPHLFNSRIPLELEQVVVRALSLDPGDRYTSVDALLEALTTVDNGRGIKARTSMGGT